MLKELRDVERLSFDSKEVQENLVESLHHQPQDVEKRGTISCLSTKGCKRGHKRYKASRTREKLQNDSLAAREELRKIKEDIDRKEKRFSEKVDRTGWQMRRWKQSFRDCKVEKKEEVATHRRQVMAAWRFCGNNLSAWEQMELRPCTKAPKGNGSSTRADAKKRRRTKE